jgi:hypothetical protein
MYLRDTPGTFGGGFAYGSPRVRYSTCRAADVRVPALRMLGRDLDNLPDTLQRTLECTSHYGRFQTGVNGP